MDDSLSRGQMGDGGPTLWVQFGFWRHSPRWTKSAQKVPQEICSGKQSEKRILGKWGGEISAEVLPTDTRHFRPHNQQFHRENVTRTNKRRPRNRKSVDFHNTRGTETEQLKGGRLSGFKANELENAFERRPMAQNGICGLRNLQKEQKQSA